MQKQCRSTCKNWMKETTSLHIPEELTQSGVYEDSFKDVFGLDINFCNMNSGYTNTAQDKTVSMLNDNIGQPKLIPKFHSVGFEKVKIPRKMYGQILTNRKKILSNKKKWSIEYYLFGIQNFNKILESEQAQECHEVSRENYFYPPMSQNTLGVVFKDMLPLAERWISNKIRLNGTAVYGIRKYTRGAKLAAHVDHMETHVISAIMNITQL